MAKKSTVDRSERFENQDFDLFAALDALDRKDYGWWDTLTEEQQRKWVPYMIVHWMSAIRTGGALGSYYLLNTDIAANKYLFNEVVSNHPKLQWLMMCSISPQRGKQYHQWIPHLSEKISRLKTAATQREIESYYEKVYTSASPGDIAEISTQYVAEQNQRAKIAEYYPDMKYDDIVTLSSLVNSKDIEQYEKDSGRE